MPAKGAGDWERFGPAEIEMYKKMLYTMSWDLQCSRHVIFLKNIELYTLYSILGDLLCNVGGNR
jgi:hypothetical protein